MTETKSYVRYIKKQGVSGGSGFELEVQVAKGDTQKDIEELGRIAGEASNSIIKELLKKNL